MKTKPVELNPGVIFSIHDPTKKLAKTGEAIVFHRDKKYGGVYYVDKANPEGRVYRVPDIDARYFLDQRHWRVTGKIKWSQQHSDYAKQQITRYHGPHMFMK